MYASLGEDGRSASSLSLSESEDEYTSLHMPALYDSVLLQGTYPFPTLDPGIISFLIGERCFYSLAPVD